jgi:hypothetical protein
MHINSIIAAGVFLIGAVYGAPPPPPGKGNGRPDACAKAVSLIGLGGWSGLMVFRYQLAKKPVEQIVRRF